MKNNIIVVLLSVLIGACVLLSLLVGVNNAVQVANLPMYERMSQLVDNQKELVRRTGEINAKIDALDKKMNSNNFRNAAMPQNAPPMPQPPVEDFDKVYEIPDGASVIVGNKNAKVTIVEFSDFQCPYCKMFGPILKQLMDAYPQDLRVIIKHFPLSFHPNARPAAKIALAANEQGKYMPMVELLLENGADVSEAKLKEYSKTLGINFDRLSKDVKEKDAQYEASIAVDMALAEKVDMRGTPTFYLNYKKTRARDLTSWKSEIDKILASK